MSIEGSYQAARRLLQSSDLSQSLVNSTTSFFSVKSEDRSFTVVRTNFTLMLSFFLLWILFTVATGWVMSSILKSRIPFPWELYGQEEKNQDAQESLDDAKPEPVAVVERDDGVEEYWNPGAVTTIWGLVSLIKRPINAESTSAAVGRNDVFARRAAWKIKQHSKSDLVELGTKVRTLRRDGSGGSRKGMSEGYEKVMQNTASEEDEKAAIDDNVIVVEGLGGSARC
jgi:hypothetical protein